MNTLTLNRNEDSNCFPMYKRKNLVSQKDAIEYFIHKMDIEMIDAFLDEDKTYQEFEKKEYLHKLEEVFDALKAKGDTLLFPIEGKCSFCDKSKSGFTFYGNKTKLYLSIVFDEIDGRINDLYDCTQFCNTTNNLELKEQLFIV